MDPHEDYRALCKRVPWAYADSWYQECDYCKRVELVLPSLAKSATLICESCFSDGLDESSDSRPEGK